MKKLDAATLDVILRYPREQYNADDLPPGAVLHLGMDKGAVLVIDFVGSHRFVSLDNYRIYGPSTYLHGRVATEARLEIEA